MVDDYKRWQHFVAAKIAEEPAFQIIGKASDGFEAVQRAQETQPDLILLDVGLPAMNGIEAALRIKNVSPALFLSENRSPVIVEKALGTGAEGYVLKSDSASDLLTGIRAVLEGKRFLSSSLAG